MSKIQFWAEELEVFDDVMDQYAMLIDMAKEPTTLPVELRSDDKLVSGCMSLSSLISTLQTKVSAL